jgi:death-on-curing protein
VIVDASDIIDIHRSIIQKTGGSLGVLNLSGIDSALQSIYQTFEGKDIYPSIVEKATRLSYQLNQSHSFFDGNKRIAMHMLGLYLRFHEIPYAPSNQEVVHIGFSVAKGLLSYSEFLAWVTNQTNK